MSLSGLASPRDRAEDAHVVNAVLLGKTQNFVAFVANNRVDAEAWFFYHRAILSLSGKVRRVATDWM